MIVSKEFEIIENGIYLNHAAMGPWPARTAEAVAAFARENVVQASKNYPQWLEVENRLRARLQRLIHAPSRHDIALVKNTSEGLSLVAYGLDWRPGDNVVTIKQEFPSNRILWQSLTTRFGVQVRHVDLSQTQDAEAALQALCDENTRLMAVSSVQFGNGLALSLGKLGRFCRANGVLFCVDAIQSVGALHTDVQADQVDFLVADGHKWMLSAEGLALFYSRPEARGQLHINQFGWHMLENPVDYDSWDWRISADARRFECGSPNFLGIHALESSLSLLEEVGMATVTKKVLEHTDYLISHLSQLPVELLSDTRIQRRSGIVSLRLPNKALEQVQQSLNQQGIVTALRAGGIRLSPHFYTPDGQLHRTVQAIAELAET